MKSQKKNKQQQQKFDPPQAEIVPKVQDHFPPLFLEEFALPTFSAASSFLILLTKR